MLLAAEAKLCEQYINAKQSAMMLMMLNKTGHPQPPMPIQTDDSTAYSIITNKIIPKAPKMMDMYFHWLHDHEQQQKFHINW